MTATKTPQVSVIIPAYNGSRYIQQAVESVLHQTYGNWELIIVDDGSTDNTRQVLQQYGEKLQYIYQDNQGVAAARNRGIALSRGKWLVFLDQDDYILPDKLTLQVACFQTQPHLGIVNSGWYFVNSEGQVIGEVKSWENIPQLTLADWVVWKPVFLGAMMFEREWLAQVGGFDTRLQQTSDVDLVLRLAHNGCRAAWVRQSTVCYRQHEGNVSRNVLEQARELELVLERFFARPNLAQEVRQLEYQSRYQSLVWSAARLYSIDNQAGMAEYLEKSLKYSSYSLTETLLNWVECFKTYAAESGGDFDIYKLTNRAEWQQLMNGITFNVTKY